MKVQLIERAEDSMKYEYNGNLLENDRITLVANEIVNKYPYIDINKAKEAAMLEGKISSKINVDMQFNRLYNIMLIISDDRESVKPVYTDLITLLNNNKTNEKINYYYTVVLEIANYLLNKREFPYLNEF